MNLRFEKRTDISLANIVLFTSLIYIRGSNVKIQKTARGN
jgi:hypothetical protein